MNRDRVGINRTPFLSRWTQPYINQGLALTLMGLSAFSLPVTLPTMAQAQVSPSPTPAATARPTLRLGSQGATVTELQALLKLLGFYQGTVDGNFQDSTATAVIAFQQAAGLTADGIVGSNTWNRLLPSATTTTAAAAGGPATTQPTPTNSRPAVATPSNPTVAANPASEAVNLPTLRLGMRGPAVARLQQRLRTLGMFDGEVDGVFGPATQNAVKAAQRRYNLTPDGVVGNATWSALLR
ncbi:peptidoglycan-binding protein [Oscillatoria sp. FACHB-1407]|uniref:peptidoglycan-binding domain-containing protein n=1 Tax=Oscillatoria sp. FACHB-1407 TaxID=2692847 RepID=UPI0016824E0B|nr:peptidoglycan-binding protein [Oscillatoria sp. FACHB-1407]MBD2462721.1 peptidoglycan-binding protein [Oscillatoria sp. FACHB-1407]